MNSLGLSGIMIIMIALFTSGIVEGVTLDNYLKLVQENNPFFKKENLSKIIEQKTETENPKKLLPASRTWQKIKYPKSRYSHKELKEKPRNLTHL